MSPEKYAIVALLAMQAVSLFLLWETQKAGEWFRKAWIRESRELLTLKKGQD